MQYLKIQVFTAVLCISASHAAVTLKVNGLTAEVSNDLVKFKFKKDASISSLYVGEENVVSGADRSFYLDWTGTGGEIRLKPSSIEIVEQTDSIAHFYWVQQSSRADDAFHIELHYILEDDLSGIYSYVKYTNDKASNISFGETRMIYRFNPSIFTNGVNQVFSHRLPTKNEITHSQTVQDSTYKFSNGTYFSKYDYGVYIRETQYQGVFGHDYGAFVISPSREYHGGGAMKQDLTVHQYSLVSNYFLSAHFGSASFNAPPGWTHIYGPFLIYFPSGNDEQILNDVEAQVTIEQEKWPYSFVNDNDYPLIRGSVSGKVTGQTKAAITLYDSTEEQYDLQQLGYLYTTNTDANGNFVINNVRPGFYKIVAYPIAGQGSENLAEQTVTITAGGSEMVDFLLPEPENILWAIGEANRRSNEFNYADQDRNYKWEFEPPVENTFVVGESDPKNDWYYAQSQPGTWRIKYQDNYDGHSRTLRLPLAAASKSVLQVYINGNNIAQLDLTNDASIYRSALQSGRYRSVILPVEASHVVTGENNLDLTVHSGAVMYDCISLQVNT